MSNESSLGNIVDVFRQHMQDCFGVDFETSRKAISDEEVRSLLERRFDKAYRTYIRSKDRLQRLVLLEDVKSLSLEDAERHSLRYERVMTVVAGMRLIHPVGQNGRDFFINARHEDLKNRLAFTITSLTNVFNTVLGNGIGLAMWSMIRGLAPEYSKMELDKEGE